jgi:protein tyrosine phosphatase
MFTRRQGMFLLGKDTESGQVPSWSYLVWAPFHFPTIAYTYIHYHIRSYRGNNGVNEILEGWYLGGRYSTHDLNGRGLNFAAAVDLTCEFSELCRDSTDSFLSVPVWDGVPPTPVQLEQCACFVDEAAVIEKAVLVHCAHGVGRSTTVMCAALVRAGMATDWRENFDICKRGRPIVETSRHFALVLPVRELASL